VKMMKTLITLALGLFVLALCASWVPAGLAAQGPKDLVYKGKTRSDVKFSHASHAKKDKCAACHPKLFKTKMSQTKFTMADITAGKACAVCHDGKAAFAVKQCAKCHVSKAAKKAPASGCGGECRDCKGCGK